MCHLLILWHSVKEDVYYVDDEEDNFWIMASVSEINNSIHDPPKFFFFFTFNDLDVKVQWHDQMLQHLNIETKDLHVSIWQKGLSKTLIKA